MNYSTYARLLCASMLLLWGAHTSAQAPAAPDGEPAKIRQPNMRPDRVWRKDIEGVWMSQKYLEGLKQSRSPRVAAQKAHPIVIQIKKDNGVYPILTTNFHSVVLNFLIEIEPDKKPNSWRLVTAETEGAVNAADASYTYFGGKRDKSGALATLLIKEPHFGKGKPTPFVRLNDPLETYINKHTLSGKYRDEQGRAYEFTAQGDAVLPDRKFAYEILLDTAQSNCDVLLSHHEKDAQGSEKIGFAFKGDKVALYKVQSPAKGTWRCDAQPYATLTRGETT